MWSPFAPGTCELLVVVEEEIHRISFLKTILEKQIPVYSLRAPLIGSAKSIFAPFVVVHMATAPLSFKSLGTLYISSIGALKIRNFLHPIISKLEKQVL